MRWPVFSMIWGAAEQLPGSRGKLSGISGSKPYISVAFSSKIATIFNLTHCAGCRSMFSNASLPDA
jgi:hypothetical protein